MTETQSTRWTVTVTCDCLLLHRRRTSHDGSAVLELDENLRINDVAISKGEIRGVFMVRHSNPSLPLSPPTLPIVRSRTTKEHH
jgi:hypothetical protein